ncbi:hypothetical protein O0I10_007408 [Lichtheimia ornata]|uniref:HORMA domain-containing protein n=1 Tax=Lichtheimia ornata TaxID=688661 RepID=A0AAD7XXT8_9FUNG|nr:uncharacterized protein O0I10_007408 [Lichtheimia ornata]KAJ8656811.1 hypothetical protein O0I10_007408 [Lichtheimia ornata]
MPFALVEVWIHEILFQRDVYPSDIFELRKKYDAPVHMATHDGVIDYVGRFMQSVHTLICKNNCRSISLIIRSTSRPLEKFTFEVHSVLDHASKQDDIPLDELLESESSIALDDLEQQLRACLLRINACQSFLSANPPECTFSLVVETNLSPPIFDNQSSSSSSSTFVPSDVSEQVHHHKWNNLIPIKTISMDAFRINTFVLEAIKKGKHAVK